VPVTGDFNVFRSHYAVSADGARFVVDSVEPSHGSNTISVLLNWQDEE
jgi:hypothetical protein